METTPLLEIESRIRSYAVLESASLAEAVATATAGTRALLLVDSQVRETHAPAFEGWVDSILEIEASEDAKSFERLGPLFTSILERGFRRDWILVAVGGGVTQDIAAFIASVLFRGAQWCLIPTTLLAQCDSCIGSKSSINIGSFKNQLGTFYPPQQVLLNLGVLDSLPPEAIAGGLGEIIKLHLIAGESEFTALRARLDASEGRPARDDLRAMILSSLRIKKKFIEADEMDTGIRNLLNYGHTFGHAFESATNYAIPHGIAVSLGIAAATFFSARLNLVEEEYALDLQSWLSKYFHPCEKQLREVDAERVLSAMKLDKKNTGTKITCILTCGAGRMEKRALDFDSQVRPLLGQWLQQL